LFFCVCKSLKRFGDLCFWTVRDPGPHVAHAVQKVFSPPREVCSPQPFRDQIMEHNYQQVSPLATLGEDEFVDLPLLDAISPSMRAVVALIRDLSQSHVPVLLIGEHGTGKQSIAHAIHLNSGGTLDQFQVRSCAESTPDGLDPKLLPPAATLYLSEISELPDDCQKKLLEILAKQGSNGNGHRELRIICANSRDLDADVRSGDFREDLYYRISGVCLRVPPLRQRREDIAHLITFFLQRYSEAYHRPLPTLSSSTHKLFLEHSWPGNLPELEAAVRAIVAVGNESVAMGGLRSLLTRGDSRSNGEKTSLKEASRAASREAERELILKVLTRTRWNRRRAAQELQISYKALLYKLKQIGYSEFGAS
jgi:two-component system response regulator AtoC